MESAAHHIVVVGGSGGIGSAVVARYIDAGMKVTVVDRQPPFIDSEIKPDESIDYIPADVTSASAIEQMCVRLKESSSPVNHVVSLAGGALDSEFQGLGSTDTGTIHRSIDLNLTSHICLVRALLPLLQTARTPDRSITLVSSINALRDYGLPAYSAAKAGLLGLVRSTVSELGGQGVRINAVLPGTVITGSTSTQPKDFEALRSGSALGRLASPGEIAGAVFALSHVMTAVTGQSLAVDCGQTLTTVDWRTHEVTE